MQPVNLNSALPGLPMLNPRPSSRLGLLLDALQPTPGQSVSTTRGTEAAQRVTADTGPPLGTPAKPVEAASPTRLSEAGLMLAQMGMKPRTPLELMLRFSAVATAPATNGELEAGLAGEAAETGATGAAGALAATSRLAEVDSRHLAQQLRNVITRSGLFYESHVNEWMQGRRSLAELQQEPQQRWAAERHSPPANDAQWGHESGRPTPESGPRMQTDPAARAANDATYVDHTRQTGAEGGQPTIPAALEDLVARQLDVLATRQLHLHLLPGQDAPVSLMIAQEQEGNTAQGMQAWVTEIECTLPELGTVHARLRLLGDQLAVTVRAADGTRADWLDAQLGELRKLLERSGLSPAVLEVRHEP